MATGADAAAGAEWALDDAVLLEEARIIEAGRAAGRAAGAERAAREARETGRLKGLDLGLELGFYYGAVRALRRLQEREKAKAKQAIGGAATHSPDLAADAKAGETAQAKETVPDLQRSTRRGRELAQILERLKRENVMTVLLTLEALLLTFPAGQPFHDDTHAKFLKIRTKFKVLEARLGIVLDIQPDLEDNDADGPSLATIAADF